MFRDDFCPSARKLFWIVPCFTLLSFARLVLSYSQVKHCHFECCLFDLFQSSYLQVGSNLKYNTVHYKTVQYKTSVCM